MDLKRSDLKRKEWKAQVFVSMVIGYELHGVYRRGKKDDIIDGGGQIWVDRWRRRILCRWEFSGGGCRETVMIQRDGGRPDVWWLERESVWLSFQRGRDIEVRFGLQEREIIKLPLVSYLCQYFCDKLSLLIKEWYKLSYNKL